MTLPPKARTENFRQCFKHLTTSQAKLLRIEPPALRDDAWSREFQAKRGLFFSAVQGFPTTSGGTRACGDRQSYRGLMTSHARLSERADLSCRWDAEARRTALETLSRAFLDGAHHRLAAVRLAI